ncbi:MAG: flavodoxin family protein [Prevotellaceae bacterium]|jgi:multimeric flavodoxin WrbA|nr:flavodoxin family protein [Prevotellaceae bacterium]
MKKREFIKASIFAGTGLIAGNIWGRLTKKSDKTSKKKKVIAINGSPNENGNTAYALSVIGEIFKNENIKFEIIHIGKNDIRGCIACMRCHNEQTVCVHAVAEEKAWIETMKTADALILASPTYFGGITGTMKSFLDKAFYSGSKYFSHKVGATIVTTRRTGASMTFEGLNQYFTINQMPVASSTYWNNIRGLTIDDLQQDGEGIRTLQNLAKNIIEMI